MEKLKKGSSEKETTVHKTVLKGHIRKKDNSQQQAFETGHF